MIRNKDILINSQIAIKLFELEQLNRRIDINNLMNLSAINNEYVQEFISTNTIEGDELSFDKASKLIENEKLSDDELMKRWIGVKYAHDVIWDDKFEFRIENIHEAHRALMRRVGTPGGVFKTKLNKVGTLYGALPSETPKLTNDLIVDFLLSIALEGYGILNSVQFISSFLAIHPYEDGNGRISRLLFNLLMYRAGYKFVKYVSLSKFIYEMKSEYLKALEHRNKAYEEKNITVESITPLILFFIEVLIQAAKKAIDFNKLIKYSKEELQSKFLLLVSDKGISRQQVLEELKCANSIQSINAWLKELVDANKVKRVGENKASKYFKY